MTFKPLIARLYPRLLGSSDDLHADPDVLPETATTRIRPPARRVRTLSTEEIAIVDVVKCEAAELASACTNTMVLSERDRR